MSLVVRIAKIENCQNRQNRKLPLHSTRFALVFQLFCFSSQKAAIWCAGVNLEFVNILILYFLTNRVRTVHILLLHSARFAPVSQLFCFSSQRAVIWCAGMNFDFVNILILYFLAIRVPTVHILHCTAHISHRFPNFFVFQAVGCNIFVLEFHVRKGDVKRSCQITPFVDYVIILTQLLTLEKEM